MPTKIIKTDYNPHLVYVECSNCSYVSGDMPRDTAERVAKSHVCTETTI